MKYLLLFVFSAFFIAGCATAQPGDIIGTTPLSEKNIALERIVDAPELTKDQIYTGSRIWIAENFKSSKSVIEYESKEDGTIMGNGSIPYPCEGSLNCMATAGWKVPFTMRIDVKDEKFRLTFTNISVSWPPTYNYTLGAQSGYEGPIKTQEQIDAVRPILFAFGDSILSSIQSDKKVSDW